VPENTSGFYLLLRSDSNTVSTCPLCREELQYFFNAQLEDYQVLEQKVRQKIIAAIRELVYIKKKNSYIQILALTNDFFGKKS
jgi:hypothetical protein